jgi:hypothetical protein
MSRQGRPGQYPAELRNSSRMFRVGQYLRWPAYVVRSPRNLVTPVLRGADGCTIDAL